MISLQQLFESAPDNPDTIILKNEYYPRGLTEQQVYDYYMSQKNLILEQTKNRDLMFFLVPNMNETIVKRRTRTGFIRLNNTNYEKVITGRTLSIHSTMRRKEDIFIIDIDVDDFEKAKNIVFELEATLLLQSAFPASYEIRYTGKNSFHIVLKLPGSQDIDIIRKFISQTLETYGIGRKYNLNKPGRRPNIDLSSNKFRGGFITLGSLSTLGLRCMKVEPRNLRGFRKEHAKIKV